MNDKNYNGWTNYETWNIKLWIDNEEGSYKYWQEAAESAWNDAEADSHNTRAENATHALREQLRGEFEEANPLGNEASCWADLLGAALSEVNWHEIANSMIDDGDFEEEEETADA